MDAEQRVSLLERGMALASEISPHYDDVLREASSRIGASGSVGKGDIAMLAFWKRIPTGSWVLFRSDWSKRTGPAFLNEDETGAHSPGPHVSTSRFLAYERDVLGVGTETVGTDAGQAFRFDPPLPNHRTMHGAGKFGLASVCNLDQLPPKGALVIAAPLKIVGGSGSPVRAIALAPV